MSQVVPTKKERNSLKRPGRYIGAAFVHSVVFLSLLIFTKEIRGILPYEYGFEVFSIAAIAITIVLVNKTLLHQGQSPGEDDIDGVMR